MSKKFDFLLLLVPVALTFVVTMTHGVEKIDKEIMMTRYGPAQYTNKYHQSHYSGSPSGAGGVVGGNPLHHQGHVDGHGHGHGGVSFSMDPTNGLVVVVAIIVIVTLCGVVFSSVARRGGGGYSGGGWGSPYGRTIFDRSGEIMMTSQVLNGVEKHYGHTAPGDPYDQHELEGI